VDSALSRFGHLKVHGTPIPQVRVSSDLVVEKDVVGDGGSSLLTYGIGDRSIHPLASYPLESSSLFFPVFV
jgi:hypothetical protein